MTSKRKIPDRPDTTPVDAVSHKRHEPDAPTPTVETLETKVSTTTGTSPFVQATAEHAAKQLRQPRTVAIECRGVSYDWLSVPLLVRAVPACKWSEHGPWDIGVSSGCRYSPSTPPQYVHRWMVAAPMEDKRSYTHVVVYAREVSELEDEHEHLLRLAQQVHQTSSEVTVLMLDHKTVQELQQRFPECTRRDAWHVEQTLTKWLARSDALIRPPVSSSRASWSQILPRLYVGDCESATHETFLHEHKIHCVVSVGEMIDSKRIQDIVPLHLTSKPFYDSERAGVGSPGTELEFAL